MCLLLRLALANFHSAADAASHLFFAYLRSISPDLPRGLSGISTLPIALQSLVQATEYPPETPSLLQVSTTKVVMIVDTVSPTPIALLRRARNFEYRDSDHHLQQFSSFEDPIRALTDECIRVLRSISSTNQSSISSSKTSTSLRDASWSRFEDIGFGTAIESEHEDDADTARGESESGLRSTPHSGGADLGRPTTPSWADFLSSGFTDENANSLRGAPTSSLLPPDKMLPPIPTDRGQSSQSHKRALDAEPDLEPGELASITTLDLDDSFWWVWISSLAGEEPVTRKAVFGRCTLVETIIKGAKWLVLEEQVKGAAPEPEPGAYIVEKKRFFGFSRRGKLSRRKSSAKKMEPREQPYKNKDNPAPQSKTSIAPDQHARIQAAAAELQKKHREQEQEFANGSAAGGDHDMRSMRTNSALTLQPSVMTVASQAMKWTTNYDKNAYRSAYLSDTRAGTGAPAETLRVPSMTSPNDKPESTLSPTPSATSRQPPPPADTAPVASPPPTPKPNAETTVGEAASAKEGTDAAPEKPPTAPQPKPAGPAEGPTKKLKKKPANPGIKGMFGNKGKTEQPPMKPTGAEPSTVAAARAALEGKAKASQRKPQVANGSSSVRKPAPDTPATDVRTGSDKPASPEAPDETVSGQTYQLQLAMQLSGGDAGPPKTQQSAEADALSRVDTNEQDAADREFSRFDQGPLVEQPAFAPEDSPAYPEPEPEPVPEKTEPTTSPDGGRSMKTTSNGRSPSPPSAAVNASPDRFAPIRNTAKRTAHGDASGDQSIDTEPTGDSETSGEESK